MDLKTNGGCTLTAISSTESRLFKNITWGPEDARKSHLTGETILLKTGDEAEWKTFSFTFKASENCEVSFNMRVSHSRSKGNSMLNQARVFISEVIVEGATLKNGDFSAMKGEKPSFWNCTDGVEFTTDENGVCIPIVWHNAPIRQTIEIEADTPITVRFSTQFADFHEATE